MTMRRMLTVFLRCTAALLTGFIVLAVPGADPAQGGEDDKAKTRPVVITCDAKGARFFVNGKEWWGGKGEIPASRSSITVTVLVEDCAPQRRTITPSRTGTTEVKFPAPASAPWPTISAADPAAVAAWESAEYGWFTGPRVPPGEGRPYLGRTGMTTQALDRRRLGPSESCVLEPGPWTPRGAVLDLLELQPGSDVRIDGAKLPDGARIAPGPHVMTVGSGASMRTYNFEVTPTRPAVRVPAVLARRTAVENGLAWLAKHQSADGSWSSSRFPCTCAQPCEAGAAGHDVGVTGLALLAFLGADDSPDCGPYAPVVSKALDFLLRNQTDEGRFGNALSRSGAFGQPIAELAVLDAWSRAGDPKLYDAARRGMDAIYYAQNPYLAWQYGIRDGANDTAVTAWMALAVTHALAWDLDRHPFADLRGKVAGARVEGRAEGSLWGALAWFDKMTEPHEGRVGYDVRGGPQAYHRVPPDRGGLNERFGPRDWALTSVSLVPRLRIASLLGFVEEPDAPSRRALANAERNAPFAPQHQGGFDDVHAAYFGARLFSWQRGALPVEWRACLDALGKRQRATGGFPPDAIWSAEGGAVFTTAMSVLALEQDRKR